MRVYQKSGVVFLCIQPRRPVFYPVLILQRAHLLRRGGCAEAVYLDRAPRPARAPDPARCFDCPVDPAIAQLLRSDLVCELWFVRGLGSRPAVVGYLPSQQVRMFYMSV